MPRVRSRRSLEVRDDWPLTAAEEYAAGSDLTRYTSKLARFFARNARHVRDIEQARDIERQWRQNHPEARP